jgi:hypothetical protein
VSKVVQSFASDLFQMTNDAEVDMGNIENALNSLKSSFSGTTAPSAEQGQLWYDTNRALLRHRGAVSNWRGVIAGSGAFKIWVYANATEEGFTEDTDCADCVIAVKGGSQAYNVTGGDGNPKGVWAITGLTKDAHTHSTPVHIHTMDKDSMLETRAKCDSSLAVVLLIDQGPDATGLLSSNRTGAPATSNNQVWSVKKTTVSGGSGTSGGQSTPGVTSAGTWRPQAAVGIMVYPALV